MKTVVIGMSGGVDSSVAAILLKKAGYNVIGLFMRNWDSTINNDYLGNPNLNNNICPQEQDYNDALEVCNKINIPLHRVDFAGICFIGERNFTQFLENYLPNIPGNIVNIDTGEILGKHIGLMYYTIGQRRGLNIGGTKDRTFVVKKDLDKNILYVAVGDDNKYLYSSTAIIEEFNYLTDKRPSKCTCKFRYRQSDIDINVKYLDNNNLLLSYKGSKAVTPGQFCVLYDKDICLGGGIIKEVK